MSLDRLRLCHKAGVHCLAYHQESDLSFTLYNFSGKLTLCTNSQHPKCFYGDTGLCSASNCCALEQCSTLGNKNRRLIDYLSCLVSVLGPRTGKQDFNFSARAESIF